MRINLTKQLYKLTICTGFLLFFTFQINAQSIVTGQVVSEGESLIGANILILGTDQGVSTDIDGNFQLKANLPAELKVSYTGYDDNTVTVTEENKDNLVIELKAGGVSLDQVVVGASRHSERFVEAPVTVEKLDAATLKASAAEGVFEALTNLKGVQVVKGSISGPVINTRGFGNMNNLRFLMHLDGMDVTSPGFGVYGNVGGVSNLDVQSVEIIPGSSSALYGANAFNGILLMKTKDPFLHQGISAQLKTGVSVQKAAGTNPLNGVSVRIAKAFNDKFAFKVDYEGMFATDWIAEDLTARQLSDKNPLNPANRNPEMTSPDQPSYNAVTIHGDADAGGFTRALANGNTYTTTGGQEVLWDLGNVNRTGYTEKELFDPKVSNHRFNASLAYKINDDFRVDYTFKYGLQDLVLRHTTSYPFYDFNLTHHKVALTGKGLTARWYHSAQDVKNTWTTVFLAASIQTQLMSNADWGQRFLDAYYGEIEGVAGSSISGARAYADSAMPVPGSDEFIAARDNSLSSATVFNPDGLVGSRLVDNSSFWQADVLYDFTDNLIKDESVTATMGINYRKYTLESGGAFFNDNRRETNAAAGGDIGYDSSIPVTEYGVFGQIGKKFMDDRLNLSFIGRVNGHSNFDLNFTPQLSAVFSPDQDKNHNIRASFTTGVRNPGLQEQYLNFLIAPTVVLFGGAGDNFDNYYDPFYKVSGDDVRRLIKEQLDYEVQAIRPERNTTYELGYKGLLSNGKLLVDLSGYYTSYKDFVERANLVVAIDYTDDNGDAKTVNKRHAVYANITDKVYAYGFGLGLEDAVGGQYKAYANYQYNDFGVEEQNDGISTLGYVAPAFNTPKNRVNFGFARKNNKGGLGFDIAARYVSEYDYQSPMGKGYIPSFFTVDASVSYKIKDFFINLSASNLAGKEYKTLYGGPQVGSVYTLGITYDMKFN